MIKKSKKVLNTVDAFACVCVAAYCNCACACACEQYGGDYMVMSAGLGNSMSSSGSSSVSAAYNGSSASNRA